MKIATIQVGSYGLMLNRSIALGPGLNVIRGANETGKSTLLAFVRAMLFGFDKRHRSLAGGRRGGWLDLTMADGREIRVERYGERSGDGQLRVLDASGRDLGADELPRLLQGVERNLFHNVFAFGLDELAEFSNLSDREVASRIYGAGSGLGKVSLPQVEAEIWGQAEALFKPGGKVLPINILLRRLEETDKELRGLDLPRDFRQTTEQLRTYEEDLQLLANDLTAVESQRRECERVIGGWEAWVALLAATAAREALGAVLEMPAGLLEQINGLEAGQMTKAETVEKAESKRLEAEEGLAQVMVEDEVLAASAEIGELAAAGDMERARSRTLIEVAEQERQAQRDLDDSLARLGPQWNEDRVQAFDDTIATEGDTARFGKALLAAGEEVGRTAASRDQLLGEIKNLAKQIGSLRSDIEVIAAEDAAHLSLDEQERTLADLNKSIAEADSLELSLRSCREEMTLIALPEAFDPDSTREKLRAGKRLQRLLEAVASTASLAASATSEARQGKRAVGVGVGLAGLAVAAVCVALGAPIFVGLLVLVPGTVAAAILIWPQLLPASGSEIHNLIRAQVAQTRSESAQIATDLGLQDVSADAAAAYVETCEKQLANAERLNGLQQRSMKLQASLEAVGPRAGQILGLADRAARAEDIAAFRVNLQAARDRRSSRLGFASQLSACERQLGDLEGQAGAAEEKLANAQKALATVAEEWRSWLEVHSLSRDIDPETAKTTIETVTSAKRVLRSLQSLRGRETSLEAEQKAFSEFARTVGDRLSLNGEQDGLVIVLRLKARLDAAKAADSDRRAARSKLETAQKSETEARSDLDRVEAEIKRILGEHGVDELQRLREEIKTADVGRSLDMEVANRTKTLTALSGPGEALVSFKELLQSTRDISDVKQQANELGARFTTLDASRRELTEKLGALRGQIASIEHDVSASEKRQLRSDLFARLQSRSEDWAELALATKVIAECRESYEATHRPAVVQEAERLFVIWTGSRYERLLAPVGGMVEEIQHREGRRVPLADLSKGTAEQLYLALRFGLVSHFTETAEALPILMDDILVNFDDDRADSAARSIEELAQRHQVIYFTCHPQTPLRGGCEIELPALQTVSQAKILQSEI